MATDTKEMTDEEIRERILQLGFGADQHSSSGSVMNCDVDCQKEPASP